MLWWLQKVEAAPAVVEPAAEKPAEVNDKPSVTETAVVEPVVGSWPVSGICLAFILDKVINEDLEWFV